MDTVARQPLKSTIFKTSIKVVSGSGVARPSWDHSDLCPEGPGGRVRGLVTSQEALDSSSRLPETEELRCPR